jgi:hypothetical protein
VRLLPGVRAESVTSEDGQYRFRLERTWDARPRLVWIMCHPTPAAADEDDRCLRKLQALTRRWQWGGIVVVNLFALRCSDVFALKQHCAPVGAHNDEHVLSAATDRATRAVVAAWGNNGRLFGRDDRVKAMLSDNGVPLWRMGGPLSRFGQPLNPMVMPMTVLPLPWIKPTGERPSVRRIVEEP